MRARPVPFCFHSFLPEPETSHRPLVLCVPARSEGAVMFHRFPEQVFVDRAENFVGEIQCPDLLAAQIVYVDSCHMLFVSWVLANKRDSARRTAYAFFAARFAAFNGSTVAEPANPRRSRGGFFAFVIMM
jgi:hypothetical protein